MKNRDEYLESIYAKRDALIRERKKTVSVLTSILCLAICFAAVFAFVPKYFEKEIPVNESENSNSDKHIFVNTNTTDIITTTKEEFFASGEQYTVIQGFNHELITDEAGNRNMNDSEIKATKKNEAATSDNKLRTEIAAEIPDEETTRRLNFGWAGETFDPDWFKNPSLGGENAMSLAETTKDYVTEVSEPCLESPDSVYEEITIARTSASKPKSSEEAIAEAKNVISKDDASKLIDEKTQVTITRTASGKTTYTVYFYTQYKSFIIELDAVTLRVIECKEKNLISGKDSYYSPAHFPETTAALPEYKPR
ncbi:MAG: hypothetical protein IKJ41_05215 [Clostridia bacterium]|nr:hypothetical protein [Clostridia bacterium]